MVIYSSNAEPLELDIYEGFTVRNCKELADNEPSIDPSRDVVKTTRVECYERMDTSHKDNYSLYATFTP